MIFGAIGKKKEGCATSLKKIVEATAVDVHDYHWLITHCECYYPNDIELQQLLSQEYCWLTGEELSSILAKEELGCIWVVCSAFQKDIRKEDVLSYPLPYADGYEGFWTNPLTLQHPKATIEIVVFDGWTTLVLSDQKTIVDNYRKSFASSKDLTQYNQQK